MQDLFETLIGKLDKGIKIKLSDREKLTAKRFFEFGYEEGFEQGQIYMKQQVINKLEFPSEEEIFPKQD